MPTLLASDTFNRSPENPMAGNWTTAPSETGMEIIGTRCEPILLTNDCGAYYAAISWPDDQGSKAKLSCTGTVGGDQGIGLKVRQSSSAKTMYRLVVDHAASNNVTVDRFVAGTPTTVSGFPVTQAWTDGDTWELRAIGTTLSVWLNGAQIASGTDSGVASGSAGVGYSSQETAASLVDWEGWDHSSGGATVLTDIPHSRQWISVIAQ